MYYTYAYLREDNTPYYIGMGKGNRIHKPHIRGVADIRPPKHRRLYLKQNISREEAIQHEIYMIDVLGRKDRGGILINLTTAPRRRTTTVQPCSVAVAIPTMGVAVAIPPMAPVVPPTPTPRPSSPVVEAVVTLVVLDSSVVATIWVPGLRKQGLPTRLLLTVVEAAATATIALSLLPVGAAAAAVVAADASRNLSPFRTSPPPLSRA